jgi:hypothetical protein
VQVRQLAQRELCKGWAVAEKGKKTLGVPRGDETFVSEEKKALDVTRGARGRPVMPTTGPERFVADKPPPEPDYPRYRVEPGTAFRLSDVDPGETEHYRGKKEVRQQLEAQRGRIAELQERLYAENRQGLLIVLQAMDTGGKDGTI